MSKTLVRSLIAGSISAVASLSMFAAADVAHAAGGCDPIYVDNGDGTAAISYPDFCDEEADSTPTFPFFPMVPVEIELDIDDITLPEPPLPCVPLNLDNLEVRAAQTTPDDWQWRFEINGDTSNLCDATLEVEMVDLDMADADLAYPTVWNIIDVNAEGGDLVAGFNTPCHYTTSVRYGSEFVLLDQYADQYKMTEDCLASETPAPETPADPEPETPETPDTPDTPDTPEDPQPETPQQPRDPGTPGDQGLPRTGSDSTGLLVGAGMLVLGAGLAFTSVSMTRKRRAA